MQEEFRAGSGRAEVPADRCDPTTGAPFADFRAAARRALEVLRASSGMQLWMVTRAAGDEQVVLVAEEGAGDLGAALGTVLPWSSSLCRVMVAGGGPTVAPVVADVPAYAAAVTGRRAGVRSYVGAPLRRADGRLFGTLCAFDTRPQPESLRALEEHVHLKARMLATLLELELRAEEERRRADLARTAASLDPLTGVANRRAWDEVLAQEEARCRRYGHPACVVVLDLDDFKEVNDARGHAAGDDVLRRCAAQLRTQARAGDLVARLGGDEFGLLLLECDAAGGQRELERLRAALEAAGVAVSAGLGVRAADGALAAAWTDADAAMYRDKRRRRP